MTQASSVAHFKKYLITEGLFNDKRWKNLNDANWDTKENYAFAFGQIETGQMPTQKDFLGGVAKVEGFDWDTEATWPEDKPVLKGDGSQEKDDQGRLKFRRRRRTDAGH